MNQDREEILLDLLVKEATEGLTEAERRQLDEMTAGSLNRDDSFELTAAALTLASLDTVEPMPSHLRARIEDAADDWFRSRETTAGGVAAAPVAAAAEPRMGLFGWLGWAAAAIACVALIFTVWTDRTRIPQTASTGPAPPTPSPTQTLTPAQLREQLLATAPDVRKATFGPGNVKEIAASVEGDAVWSDSRQQGFLRFRGLPANDKSKETYQLWIFDETQSEKTPIAGGIFDVDQNGEVVIPIDPSLRVSNPKAFAVTIEKPGGVMVSGREKVVVLGKVESPGRPAA